MKRCLTALVILAVFSLTCFALAAAESTIPDSGGDLPAAARRLDVVINGVSGSAVVGEDGRAVVSIDGADGFHTAATADVKMLGGDAAAYELHIADKVAGALSGEGGAGVKFAAGGAEMYLPGKTLTGKPFSVALEKAAASDTVKTALGALHATQVFDGVCVRLSGVDIGLADNAYIRIEVPVGVKASAVTALLFADEDGNVISLPAKITVAGSTAYLVALLSGGGEYIPAGGGSRFTDVPSGFWGSVPISKAAGAFLVFGNGDGSFDPSGGVTRAAFCAVILRSGGVRPVEYTGADYGDVAKTDWYYDNIRTATALGLFNGYDGNAYPNKTVSRVEGMALACRMLKCRGLVSDLSAEEAESILSAYADASEIPAWARAEVAMCVKSGVIVGDGGRIKPYDLLSRAQAAAIAVRISEAITKAM